MIMFLSCSTSDESDKFDRAVWLSNSDMTDVRNPRANMTEDLLMNYLRPGIHRDSVLILLGEPYLEEIEYRLPKGLDIPDSLSLAVDSVGLTSLFDSLDSKEKNQDEDLNKLNRWYQTNSQPDTLMLYSVGWSTIDPNFLVIKFGPDSIAYDFWIEQH
jgi:hypothetical protein